MSDVALTPRAEEALSCAPAVVPVIELREVVKTYAIGEIEVRALRGVSLTVERGDFVAIMGASGSGKSTLMNIVGCLDVPDRGLVLARRRRRTAARRGRAVARAEPQDRLRVPELQPDRPHHGVRERRAAARPTWAWARASGASGRRPHSSRSGSAIAPQHVPSELSGGQQQRVAIARRWSRTPR